MLNKDNSSRIFLHIWNNIPIFATYTTDCNSSSSFQSKTVFQPHRGDFKTLFEVFSFFVARGLH